MNSKWDSLSLREKADMMKVAVANGLFTMPEIKEAYNEFAEGGNLYDDGGGFTPSNAIKKRIANWEGSSMTQSTIDPLSHKRVAKNRSFESEARDFYSVLPASIRSKVLANQQLADNLYSYSYNVGYNNFKKRVVPALVDYYSGKGSIDKVANSMWASGDAKLRGLRRRRAEEKAGVRSALSGKTVTPDYSYSGQGNGGNEGNSVEVPKIMQNSNGFEIPEFVEGPKMVIPDIVGVDPTTIYKAPVIDNTLFEQPKQAIEVVYNPKQERMDSLQRMNNLFSMMGMESPLGEVGNMVSNPLMAIANIES